MRKVLATVLFASIVSLSFAAKNENSVSKLKATESAVSSPVTTLAINGKVIDMISGEALAGVEVTIEGSTKKVHTDLDGNFKIENLQPGEYNVIASYISYNKSLIEKLEVGKSNQSVNIKLQSAN